MVLVAVQVSVAGMYLPPVLKKLHAITPAPDDHLTAGPNCRVPASRTGRIGGAGGRPGISAGIVSPASVKKTPKPFTPLHTIISLPVQTAVCSVRASGASGMLVNVQVSSMQSYIADGGSFAIAG